MAAPTVAEFKERFPELADRGDDLIELKIDEAREIYAIRKTPTLYLAAHLMVAKSLQNGRISGGSGVIRSTRLGPMQTSYITQVDGGGDQAALEAWYATSSYGQMYLEFKRHSPKAVIGARVVG